MFHGHKSACIQIKTGYHKILSGRRIGLCRRATRAPSLTAIQQDRAGLSCPILSAGSLKAKNAILTNMYSPTTFGTIPKIWFVWAFFGPSGGFLTKGHVVKSAGNL